MSFVNVYEDTERVKSYAGLEFPGTYYLAYRDLPAIISEHVVGRKAVDFGCGTGRSTRFLKSLGFAASGVDISGSMIRMAKRLDPSGTYLRIDSGDFSAFEPGSLDLVLSVFTFDNVPDVPKRCELLRGLRDLLNNKGRMVLLDSTPEIYTNEWASFTTKDFPENRRAKSGEKVRIVMTDVADRRPVEDVLWFHKDYSHLFAVSELDLVADYAPLGYEDEPYEWRSEVSIPPWIIYVLEKKA